MKKIDPRRFGYYVKITITIVFVVAAVIVFYRFNRAALNNSVIIENVSSEPGSFAYSSHISSAVVPEPFEIENVKPPNESSRKEISTLQNMEPQFSEPELSCDEFSKPESSEEYISKPENSEEDVSEPESFEEDFSKPAISEAESFDTDISESGSGTSVEPQQSTLININTADAAELQTLPGIGEVKAAAIIAYRTEHGAFTDISQIMNVSGIGEKTFENIRDMITVGEAAAPPADNSDTESGDEVQTGLVNINTASAAELQTLNGIGEKKAAAIIAYREEHGAFTDISQIKNVNGIGEKTFENIRDKITV